METLSSLQLSWGSLSDYPTRTSTGECEERPNAILAVVTNASYESSKILNVSRPVRRGTSGKFLEEQQSQSLERAKYSRVPGTQRNTTILRWRTAKDIIFTSCTWTVDGQTLSLTHSIRSLLFVKSLFE